MLIAFIVLVTVAFLVRMFPKAASIAAFVVFLILSAALLISGHG